MSYALETGTYVAPDFGEALDATPEILDASRYASQLDEYLRWFDRGQILVQTFDELERDPLKVVRAILDFLQLSKHEFGTVPHENAGAEKRIEPEWLQLTRLRLKSTPIVGRTGLFQPVLRRLRDRISQPSVPVIWTAELQNRVRSTIEAEVNRLSDEWGVHEGWTMAWPDGTDPRPAPDGADGL